MIREILILTLFPALMAFAAASDLLTMKISNRLSLALAVGFFVLAFAVGMPAAEVGWHVVAGISVLAVSFFFFARGWIGGGDAKLAAATALWLGFTHLTAYLFLASIIGGGLTLFLIAMRRYPLPQPLAETPWIARLHHAGSGVPYGIALAAAGLLVYPHTVFMRALAG